MSYGRKYILPNGKTAIYYTWCEYRDILYYGPYTQLKNSSFRPETIIGVVRGGYFPTDIITRTRKFMKSAIGYVSSRSYHDETMSQDENTWCMSDEILLLPPEESINQLQLSRDLGKDVLIVDELPQTGRTLLMVKANIMERLRQNRPNDILQLKTLTVWQKGDFQPDFYGEEVPNDVWIVTPWESEARVLDYRDGVRDGNPVFDPSRDEWLY